MVQWVVFLESTLSLSKDVIYEYRLRGYRQGTLIKSLREDSTVVIYRSFKWKKRRGVSFSPVPVGPAESGSQLCVFGFVGVTVRNALRNFVDMLVQARLFAAVSQVELPSEGVELLLTSNSARYGRCQGRKRIEVWVQNPRKLSAPVLFTESGKGVFQSF